RHWTTRRADICCRSGVAGRPRSADRAAPTRVGQESERTSFGPIARTAAATKGARMSTSDRTLPPNASLEQQRKLAKDLLNAWRAGEAAARERVRHRLPDK